MLRYSSGLLKSHIQLPADADRDQSQLSEVFQQGLAIPYQQDRSVGLGMSSALQRSQLMCSPREPTKHFGISSGGSHSSGECRVSVVGSGCSARPECEGNAAALVPAAAPSAAPGSWHGRSCSTRMGLLRLGGCVSAGVGMYLAHSSCANLGVCTQICMGSCVHICMFMSIACACTRVCMARLGMLALG